MLAPKPIPNSPTHCRTCGAELPPLRRYAGLCAGCVTTCKPPRLEDPSARKWAIIGEHTKKRRDGEIEHWVRVRCECGQERVMSRAEWRERRSLQCNRCRMRPGFKRRRRALGDWTT